MSTAQSNGNTLEFGIFDWIEWEKQPHNKIYEERLKMLEYADQNGYYCYHLAEHHVTPLSLAPSPGIFLAAARPAHTEHSPGPPGFPAALLQSPPPAAGSLHAG